MKLTPSQAQALQHIAARNAGKRFSETTYRALQDGGYIRYEAWNGWEATDLGRAYVRGDQ